MPKTKARYIKKNSKMLTKDNKENENTISSIGTEEDLTTLLKNIDNDVKNEILDLKRRIEIICSKIEITTFDEISLIRPEYRDKTIGELKKQKKIGKLNYFDMTSLLQTFANNTTLGKSVKKKKQTDDEGYLTASDSKRSTSSDRISRQRSSSMNKQNKKRTSRSLSRSRMQKKIILQAPTPTEQKTMPKLYGPVTPKVRPDKTLSILRRPKQGEYAISMQGSPLLVTSVAAETCPNVNIPMNDGRILSLQPGPSLRRSEVPCLDLETREQLEQLQKNIRKMIRLASDMDEF